MWYVVISDNKGFPIFSPGTGEMRDTVARKKRQEAGPEYLKNLQTASTTPCSEGDFGGEEDEKPTLRELRGYQGMLVCPSPRVMGGGSQNLPLVHLNK